MKHELIRSRLRKIGAPGFIDVDAPRPGDPWEFDDEGRAGEPFVRVEPPDIVAFLRACRDDDELRLEMLVDLAATDPSRSYPYLWVGYHLLSLTRCHRLAVKCEIPKDDPRMPSATPAFKAARWHERETGEMYGITFEGHPDPRHILLPDDWVGFPMRKDYQYPREYHGISCE